MKSSVMLMLVAAVSGHIHIKGSKKKIQTLGTESILAQKNMILQEPVYHNKKIGPRKEQGFSGENVLHVNKQTATNDWLEEYGPDMRKETNSVAPEESEHQMEAAMEEPG